MVDNELQTRCTLQIFIKPQRFQIIKVITKQFVERLFQYLSNILIPHTKVQSTKEGGRGDNTQNKCVRVEFVYFGEPIAAGPAHPPPLPPSPCDLLAPSNLLVLICLTFHVLRCDGSDGSDQWNSETSGKEHYFIIRVYSGINLQFILLVQFF